MRRQTHVMHRWRQRYRRDGWRATTRDGGGAKDEARVGGHFAITRGAGELGQGHGFPLP
jgi:hypothetical protein